MKHLRSSKTAVIVPTMALAISLAIVMLVGLARGAPAESAANHLAKATFAGGCFWCMQPAYDKVPGVVSTVVGYTGGDRKNPTYEEVSAGITGHAESIEVTYDPSKVTYRKLLDIFWHNVDPTTPDSEFCDVGHQYRTAIFYHDAEQEREAKESKRAIDETKPFKQPVVTEIVAASTFYPAEDYHQKYYLKNPLRYRLYRYNCGRDQRLRELWGAASGGH